MIYDDQQQPVLLSGAFLDITARKLSEIQLQRANERLQQGNERLHQRNREVMLLNQLGDMLLGCLSVEEAYEVIAICAEILFEGQSGSLHMRNAESNHFEIVSTWGNASIPEPMPEHQSCQTLWQQGLCLFHKAQENPCQHLKACGIATALCVPLVVHDETMGILHLRTNQVVEYEVYQRRQQLANIVARQLSMALTNLILRERLERQAIQDPLTGLFNRRYLDETLPREIQRAERYQHNIGVMMLDIDHFKRFNDTYGHDAGDTLLREVGAFLKRHTRGEDIACRYGGEEFTLVLPVASLDDTAQRAEEIRLGIQRLNVYHHGQPLDPVTVSIGIAAFPNHNTSADGLLKHADTCLYQAKRNGRNQVVRSSGVLCHTAVLQELDMQ
ncbi:MAG: GGDEF domain-containing protein [Chloroflexaceae bacterium]|nr:GGDEF domain-containing protein [Chloroflexaceae bacterium]